MSDTKSTVETGTGTSTRTSARPTSAERNAAVWGARAEDWAAIQEGLVDPLYRAVAKRVEIGQGKRVLDVGCGAGRFLVVARELGAEVAGLDATPELLAVAARRLPGVELRRGAIEELPYGDASFDVVTGFNAFQYAADAVGALAEARRVTRKGGLVVVATWGRPEDCEAAGHLAALKPLMPPPPPGAAPGGPFALSDEAALRGFVEKAGLAPIDVADVACPWVFPDEATALRGILSSGPLVAAMRASGEEKVRDAVLGSLAPYRTSNGGYRLENKFRYVVARKAADAA